MTLGTPLWWEMICRVLGEGVAAAAVGIDSTSSKEFTDMDWAPPSAAARAWSEERMMLLSGCWRVRLMAEVCTWKRHIQARGSVAPKQSRTRRAHSRRMARDLALSPRK